MVAMNVLFLFYSDPSVKKIYNCAIYCVPDEDPLGSKRCTVIHIFYRSRTIEQKLNVHHYRCNIQGCITWSDHLDLFM